MRVDKKRLLYVSSPPLGSTISGHTFLYQVHYKNWLITDQLCVARLRLENNIYNNKIYLLNNIYYVLNRSADMANINASSSLYTDNIHQNISSKCVTCKFGCFSINSLTKFVFILLGSKIITSGQ